MHKSSSIHSLNADNGLNLVGKVKWLIFNTINNVVPLPGIDKSLTVTDFIINDIDSGWDEFRKPVSPARRLCDLFWKNLPLQAFNNDLGGSIKALEVGCGSGIYGDLLNQLLDGKVQYRGVDIASHPMWETYTKRSNFEFFKADSSDIGKYLSDVNFILTQSALEHFIEDLSFFMQVAEYVRSTNSTIIQVHLMPSERCIITFPWHGIRQYSLHTISRITKLFSESTNKTLYRLGSSHCNKIHMDWITRPRFLRKEDRREKEVSIYEKELYTAIKADMDSPKKEACFYALIMKSIPSITKK